MNKREFFINAMQAGRFSDKRWVFAAFSVLRPNKTGFEGMKPWDILYIDPDHHESNSLVFIDGEGNPIELSDFAFDYQNPTPPFQFKEKLKLTQDEMVNLQKKEIETTYGNVLANWLLCVYPFGDKIEYFEGRFSLKAVEKVIEKKLSDEPEAGKERDANKIYVDEYTKYRRAASLIDGFTQLAVPSATAKSMTRNPETEKFREELLKKYEGQLHDPAVAAKVDAAMVAFDKAWMEGDEAMGFYHKDAYFSVMRKKAHSLVGFESAFSETGEGEMIPRSLSEGIDPDKLPAMINSLREGSYDRGASTALGGEAVKFILRVMQNSTVEEQDCKSKLGMSMVIEKEKKDTFVGNYVIEGSGIKELTNDNIDGYVGKTVVMRSPLFCRTPNAGFCATCIGRRYGEHATSLPTAASNVGSTFLNTFMALMHGVELKTAKLDWKSSLT
jgi:hypothetical protein